MQKGLFFMKITWIGQAGLLIEKNGFKIMVDPYLSDSVFKIEPGKHRRVPVMQDLFDIKPNLMIFTHNHLDHYDPETVPHFITPETEITVLGSPQAYDEAVKIGGNNNYIRFIPHTVWTEGGLKFTSVKAVHSEPTAIGVIIQDGDKKYYITGDTLYNEDIFEDIPQDIYAVFLPINGVGNNMNMIDAKNFCDKIKPKFAVPIHCGMFDSIDMNEFEYESKIIPELYKEIIF